MRAVCRLRCGAGWCTCSDPPTAVATKRTKVLVLDAAVVDLNQTDVFATAAKAGSPTLSPSCLSSDVARVRLLDNPQHQQVVPAEPTVQAGDVVVRGQPIAVAPCQHRRAHHRCRLIVHPHRSLMALVVVERAMVLTLAPLFVSFDREVQP